MSESLLFVALCFAAYRVFRLIGKDDITEPVRAAAFGDATGAVRRYARDLVCCSWCAGTWLSLAAVYSTHRWLVELEPHWLLWAVGVACVVGFLGMVDDRLSE
jgi:hypothetical protein